MTIFDELGIFSNFLFLEVVTLAYLINSQYTAANVCIFGNVGVHTSQHPPFYSISGFNSWKPSIVSLGATIGGKDEFLELFGFHHMKAHI